MRRLPIPSNCCKRLAVALGAFTIFASPCSAFAAAPSIPFTINLSEAVNVNTTGGTPRIIVDVGGVTRYATYVSGTGTSALTFTYTATAGDVDLDGISLTPASLDLNGGTVTDLNGNAIAPLTFTAPSTSNIKVSYPSFSMDFGNGSAGRYTLNGTAYNSVASFLSATGGAFTRASTATYFDNTGTMQTAVANSLRLDYNPTTNVFRGALFEEGRSNYIRNSTMTGAVAGNPGTAPTSWTINGTGTGGGATLSTEIVSTGTLNGMKYLDVRFQGNMPATGAYADLATLDVTTTTTITNVDYLVGSMWLAVVSGAAPMSIALTVSERNGSTYLGNRSLFNVPGGSLNSTLQYFSGTKAATNSSVNNFMGPRFVIGSTGTAYAFDFTLRIATPQIELGQYPTSFIPTTNAVVTRVSDLLTVPVGSWYNTNAGTMVGDFSWQSYAGAQYPMIFRFDDTGAAHRWDIFYNQPANKIAADGYTSNVGQGSFVHAAASGTSGSMKVGMAMSQNNTNVAFAGALGAVDTSWDTPTVTQFALYSYNGANRWIKNFKYYPLRVADPQLQLLTQ